MRQNFLLEPAGLDLKIELRTSRQEGIGIQFWKVFIISPYWLIVKRIPIFICETVGREKISAFFLRRKIFTQHFIHGPLRYFFKMFTYLLTSFFSLFFNRKCSKCRDKNKHSFQLTWLTALKPLKRCLFYLMNAIMEDKCIHYNGGKCFILKFSSDCNETL